MIRLIDIRDPIRLEDQAGCVHLSASTGWWPAPAGTVKVSGVGFQVSGRVLDA